MKHYTLLTNIDQHKNKHVTIAGWLYNQRSSGKIAFLQIRDGTSTIQAVAIKSELKDKIWQKIKQLTIESSLEVAGIVKKDDRSPTGFELELTDLKIIQLAPDDYPIGKKEHGPGFLLEHRHFWLRSPKQRAIQSIRNQVLIAMRDFYQTNHFTEFSTPIFSPTSCEGTTDLFEVDYFGEPAYLSQSGQLYLEAALPTLNRVFDLQPVFRAEKSKTRRHLTEFWMSNAEAAFVDHEQNLIIQEQLIQHIVEWILLNNLKELKVLKRDIDKLKQIKTPYPRITHTQAIKRLQKLGSNIKPGEDLGAEDETLLATEYDTPVFVTRYPAAIKAFYMKRNLDDTSLAECADLIAPEGHGEIIGGSQREDDYDVLLQALKDHQLNQADFQWYLDQRKYGSVPHSGFGVGIERVVKWICNLHHVRETIPFPRTIQRLRP